ncbi:hypothetical protein Acr_26g0012370 [Actinidia rufa]|uniref:Uncharacterized protein n=1 Tax=Actinidia rufa TaxID=165716 RepID=A0A7J0H4L7_9ERIC|nr:hypothetical protein Acr_26g0012370 [Actinidia rufa]
MDEELLELQRQFEFAQQAKSSIRLSERNVVELVQKLHELQIIDFDLLHTVSGKEYITPEQLRLEIVAEINKLGRVSLIDLADSIGVDLYHVEKQAQHIVANDASLMLINGEVISNSYWDTVAEEINERLQECSQIALAELAAQLQVGSELIATVLETRLGTLVKGRLEGGQLYTPAYVARVNAMVCGAARGITVPMNLSAVWSSLQILLQEMDGASGVAVENSFFQTLFNGLVKDGKILGSLRAGVHWTPTVFAIAQKETVDSFFSQNSFISYELLHKLGISQPIQYLQSRYPEGIPLDTIFVHPSMVEMLDAAADDAIERSNWIDSLLILPASFGSQDASKILSNCQSVQVALKSNKAILLGESYVFSAGFVKDLFDSMEKEMETFSLSGFFCLSISEEWLIQKIILLVPEFEEQGVDDPEPILKALANHLRPMLLNSWKQRKKVAFTEIGQRMKRVLDNLQRKIDESFLNMQLYEKALDLFEDEQSTSDMYTKLKNGIEVEESQNPESVSLSSGERIALGKSLPGPLSVKAVAVVEALEGKRVETFMTALTAIAEESGLTLKKLDKKLERSLLHSYRKDLISQVSGETDPVLLLPKVVSLLYIQVHNKALQAPGRAISVAVSRLKDKLDDAAYKILMDYHSATVALLALMSAATGDDDDCTSDRILSKREVLEDLMPALKRLSLDRLANLNQPRS